LYGKLKIKEVTSESKEDSETHECEICHVQEDSRQEYTKTPTPLHLNQIDVLSKAPLTVGEKNTDGWDATRHRTVTTISLKYPEDLV
jgi:hypothetical protein